MRVLVMRHGAAAPASFGPDAHRHLTPAGRRESEKTGEAMRAAGWTPTQIYASPLVRAMQTAERVASATGYGGAVLAVEDLVPGGSPRGAFAILEHHAKGDVILVVSHEPTVRALVGHLLGQATGPFGTGEARGLILGDTVTLDVTFGG